MPTDEDKEPEVIEPEKVEDTPEEVVEPEVAEPEKVDEPETQDESTQEGTQTEVETEVAEETPEEDKEPEVDVEALLNQITDKDEKITKLTDEFKKEQVKSAKLKDKVKSLESVVSGLVQSKLKDVPEEFHALIPDGDSVSKLNWLSKAEETGLFKKKDTAPQVEIGKPLELGNPDEKSGSKITGQQKLANYFSNHFKK